MTLKKRMSASEYRDAAYVGRKPALNTVKKWVRDGKLPGEFVGNRCYVFIDSAVKVSPTGNALADAELADMGILNVA